VGGGYGGDVDTVICRLKKAVKMTIERKIIGWSIIAGLFFWVVDAILDYTYKNLSSSFLRCLLFDVPSHEFYIRPVVFVIILGLGITIACNVKKSRISEQRYFHLFNNVRDSLYILPLDAAPLEQQKMLEVNRFACRNSGYTKEELQQLSFSDIVATDKLTEFHASLQELQANEHVVFESVLHKKDRTKFFAEIGINLFYLSGKPAALAIVRDISERRRGEQALIESQKELRNLASRLLNAQEAERERISIGLHDELGQALMHLKFRLGSAVKKYHENSQPSVEECGPLLAYLDEMIEYVRRLSRELSPSPLTELGLTSAIKYLIEEFCEHYGMDSGSVDLDDVDDAFPTETQVNIFRIFQESLTNAARHSRATSISAAARKLEDSVLFTVEDDGKGFDVKEILGLDGTRKGIGITAMQERVRMTGGSFEILSRIGAGTRVTFTIPLDNGKDYATIQNNDRR
jgi:PAS domain S-box-containing protein